MRATVAAAEPVITLSMSADHFLALLAENVELTEGIFRMMIESHGLATGRTLIHGTLAPELRDKTQDDLRAIDRVLLLQSSPLFAHATAAQLWRLSAIARPVTIVAGKEAMPKGSDASILIVLSGALQVETGAGLVDTANAGDVIGMHETLAGAKLDATITAHSTAYGLRLDRDGLFELLADHTDLLQGVFSTILRSAFAKATSASAKTSARQGEDGAATPAR
jgi:CRP-like cAMP-binding protein